MRQISIVSFLFLFYLFSNSIWQIITHKNRKKNGSDDIYRICCIVASVFGWQIKQCHFNCGSWIIHFILAKAYIYLQSDQESHAEPVFLRLWLFSHSCRLHPQWCSHPPRNLSSLSSPPAGRCLPELLPWVQLLSQLACQGLVLYLSGWLSLQPQTSRAREEWRMEKKNYRNVLTEQITWRQCGCAVQNITSHRC